MSAVTLWVSTQGEWRHGTTSENHMAVELVGTALWGLADGVVVTAPDVDPSTLGVPLDMHTGSGRAS